jgi:acetyl-CoA C-acetyltransferase
MADPLNGMLKGEATKLLAEKYKIIREEMDEIAFWSHKNACKAMAEGKFKDEIVSVPVPQRKGPPKIFDTDEHPRKDISVEDLTKLYTVFKKGGTVTAGNSSVINHGASAVVLMSGERVQKLGLKPMTRLIPTQQRPYNTPSIARDQPHVYVRVSDQGLLRCHHDVTKQGQGGSDADGIPV